MSGGRLVVLDRGGRDGKRFSLAAGLATLGSAPACDIRVMLAAVRPHHATVSVHSAQTVIRNVGDGETIVNGQSISVAALRHGDIITLGDRSLRWEYSAPNKRQQASPDLPAVQGAAGRGAGRGARGGQRASAAGVPAPRDRAAQLAIELNHRASMPASSGGKQVAIVQPQRRDTNEQTVSSSAARGAQAKRRSKPDLDSSVDSDADKRSTRISPKTVTVPSNTTKATLWIESRKSSPRRRLRRSLAANKSTPLRLAVLKKAQSAHKAGRVVKIEAPSKIDHTKQAAIMLMTGHTPKSRLSLNQSKKTPTYVIKKPSPARKTPGRKSQQGGRGSRETGAGVTPKRASTFSQDSRRSKRGSGNQSVTILETTDSATSSTIRGSSVATRASKSSQKSPLLPSPKKSALKDLSKKGSRKTESIKFDLSNLENHQESEITSRLESEESMSEDDLTLHYSESSNQSPSPRKSIHSRGSRMLERLGTTLTLSPSSTITSNSPSSRKSARSSMMVQKALDDSQLFDYTKTDQSANTTVATAFKTRTLSPRTRNMESYSIVDLVSIDSDTSKSVYNSADSTNTADYGTPNATSRKTRSTINPTLLGSSTPYVAHVRSTRSRSSPNISKRSTRSSAASRRSKSLSTPENRHISVNSTRLSRASRSRSRIGDSDLLLLDDTELEDSSPKTSRRTRNKSTTVDPSNVDDSMGSPGKDGTSTPENRQSPVEIGTPVLSIKSLLDSSRSSQRSQNAAGKGRNSVNYKRKTFGALSEPKRRPAIKSKSLGISARQTILRLSKDSSELSDRTDPGAPKPDNENTVTPKSAVKLVQEAVKNKHSTAKKPQSKRTMIDDLNQSDIVKQLFNSPVKRKLSQSMTEFSRKQLFDDDEIVIAKRPTRNTIALSGRSIDERSEASETFTPERFVSPLSTPRHSPDLSGLQRLFQDATPENYPLDARSDRSLLRTHRTRLSMKNDLTDVQGLKLMFGKSPKNRLSDVRVKKVFRASPNNDQRRVSGVKRIFNRETSPRNDLTDVRGVKKLFRKSPNNDLRNVSGVKRTLRNSPTNDLTDVRGVRKMFRNEKNKRSSYDVSGVEELFNTSTHSTHNSEALFDQLLGKPPIKAVYSKTFSTRLRRKPKTRKMKSLHSSLDVITNNVEEWLEQELQKRFHQEPTASKSRDASRNVAKELNNLVTSTVEGEEPIRASRTRNSSIKKSASEMYSAHTLPIKKRSLVESATEMNKSKLPIKKRAVVHSTPVKGRVSVTMNASELGRVSPIAAVDNTHVDHDASLTRTTRQKAIPQVPQSGASKAKTPQKTPSKPSPKPSPRKNASPKASLKKSKATSPKASPKQPESTPPKRVTRNRQNASSGNNVKKRRASLVISKKVPVISPKADPKKTRETAQESPKKRVTRGQKQQKVETPKRTRVKAQKATVVVPKPSPKLKPQAKVKEPEVVGKTTRTRKNTAAEVQTESPKKSQPRTTRGRQNDPKGKENKTDNVDGPTRGRKTTVEIEPPVNKRGRSKATGVQEVKTRGKSATKANPEIDEKQPKTRGKKVETQVSLQSEPTTRRGRKNTENISSAPQPKTKAEKAKAPVNNEPKARGKKVEKQSSTQSEPTTRGRRAKATDDTVATESRGRKRKTAATEEVPPKITKTMTRRTKRAETEASGTKPAATPAAKTKAVGKSDVIEKEIKTRGRAKQVEVEKPAPAKATRARKAAEPKQSPVADKRKRTTKVEASPTKDKKSAAAAKKARGDSAPARARSTRRKPQEESTAAGRSRRR